MNNENNTNNYFTRLTPHTEIKELQSLLPKIDRLGLSDDVVKRIGAMPLIRFRAMNQVQQINFYNNLKTALIKITRKGG
ncbi:hypothetical protein [Photobacterium carnosum]|uniref:hypothetical protein n=1 Tax=Photobacterium carnosum TaxID=2023717 RepID=UPI001E41CF0C|nr:hypothetical protein [Photobacterium carnosum]MCD9498857.1 hypothetical protein [Photobacterium carnosum]